MGRPLRFVPARSLVEVTVRTVHGRFLLRPGPALNDLVVGVLGRAQRRCAMRIHAVVFASNHAHLLLSPESAQQLASFMEYLNGNLAKEVGRLHDWREKLWARRYHAILVSEEEEAQVGRLKYLLSNGVKEGLVARPEDWPGVHCATALCNGEGLRGTWYDRTAAYTAARRGEERGIADVSQPETVTFTPLPCWADCAPEVYRTRIAELVAEVVSEGRHSRAGRPVLGRLAIFAQHPHQRPLHSDRSPAPAVHAASKAIRIMLRTAYRQFVAAFREAAQRLRRGDRRVVFPPGAFPPPLPCVISSA